MDMTEVDPGIRRGAKLVSIHREDDIDGEHEEAVFGGIQGEGGLGRPEGRADVGASG